MDDGSSRVGGHTILSQFQNGIDDALHGLSAPPLLALAAPKGPGSRQMGYSLVKKMLAWGPRLPDGSLPATRWPLLRVVGELCPYLAKTMPVLRRVPLPVALVSGEPQDGRVKDDVDPAQSDAHAYDSLRYYFQGVVPQTQHQATLIPQDIHPGLLLNGQRRSRVRNAETEQAEAMIVADWTARTTGKFIGGKFGRSARRG
jgi:hypothetical protein